MVNEPPTFAKLRHASDTQYDTFYLFLLFTSAFFICESLKQIMLIMYSKIWRPTIGITCKYRKENVMRKFSWTYTTWVLRFYLWIPIVTRVKRTLTWPPASRINVHSWNLVFSGSRLIIVISIYAAESNDLNDDDAVIRTCWYKSQDNYKDFDVTEWHPPLKCHAILISLLPLLCFEVHNTCRSDSHNNCTVR